MRKTALLLAGALLALGALAGEPPAEAPKGVRPGTARMAARLAEIAAASDPNRNPILNEERAALARALFERVRGTADEPRVRVLFGTELLLAGETDEAIEHLTAARQALAAAPGSKEAAAALLRVRETLALAYLRRGEQENCVDHHNIESCLLPIRGSGVHVRQRGSRMAFAEYLALLEEHPDNLEYRWLLNLAAMTLGEYPDKVPARWVIPPQSFDSEDEIPRFADVAPLLGLDAPGMAGGSVMDDFNGDGYLDLFLSRWGLSDPLRYFQSNGDGTFGERTAEAGLTGETGGLHTVQADYDNDGHLDVLVLRGAWIGVVGQGDHPSSLLRNQGDGTFEDVTEQAGLLGFRPTQAGAWGDYDNDGRLDLFLGIESAGPPGRPCELYRNNGDGTFTEVAAEAGVANVGFVKGATWGDYDNDGRLDLYLSRFGQPNVLYRNLGPAPAPATAPAAAAAPTPAVAAAPAPTTAPEAGGRTPWRFLDVTAAAGVTEPLKSFATWFWDYDNDGWLDLFVAPFLGFTGQNLALVAAEYLGQPSTGEQPRLYRNRGDGTFEDATREAGLAHPLIVMGSNFGDLDNDGFLDLYLGTGEPNLATLVPNRMFRNAGGRRFHDVTTAGGFGHLQKGHSISFGDLDNDGDQDVYAVLGGAYAGDVYWNALFHNPGSGNRWLTLRLEGVESNRSAIGARIRVVAETEEGTERSVHATVGANSSFGGSSLQQEIGLGRARAVRAVEVTWPRTGKVQVFRNLGMDRVFTLREGHPEPIPVELRRLDLAKGGKRHAHRP